MMPQLRRSLHKLDPNQPILSLRTMQEVIGNEVRRVGTRGQLMTTAAAIALLVAAVGIYSVIAYNVSQRTLGIRVAFGARGRDVIGSILTRSGKLIAVGVAVGSFAAWAVVRLLVKTMYQVFPIGIGAYVLTAGVLATIGLLACLVPARRALKVNPVVARSTARTAR